MFSLKHYKEDHSTGAYAIVQIIKRDGEIDQM